LLLLLADAGAAVLADAGAAVLADAGAAVLAGAGLTVLVSGALLLADTVLVSATLSLATLSSAGACAVPALPPLLLCSFPCSGSSRFFSLATGGLGVMSSL